MEPKISIIIPVYNSQETIEATLLSIFNQTYQNYEIIVVNDGSTDNTLKILEKYKNRIKIINQENKGASAARNRGAKEAQGEYLLFCDDDVIMEPEMLEKMLLTLERHPEKSYVYSSFKFGFKTFKLWPFDPQRLKEMPYIHTTSLIRKKHFLGFDESLKKFQDWDLWLSMLEKGYQGIWIPEVLFKVIPKKKGISSWLPSFFYKIPWEKLGIKIKALERYREAKKIIQEKHHLK